MTRPKGSKMTESSIERLSKALSGRTLSREHIEKIRKARRGKPLGKMSQEHKDAISVALKTSSHSLVRRERIRNAVLGRKLTQEQKDKIREGLRLHYVLYTSKLKGTKISQEHKNNISRAQLGKTIAKHSAETNKKISESLMGHEMTTNTRVKISKTMRFNYANGMTRVYSKRPTSFESIVSEVIYKFNLQFIYVGDGRIRISGKNPDFVSRDDSKVIETFSTYFKMRSYSSIYDYKVERYKAFKPREILFLDESDILGSREKLEEKICSFAQS